MPVVDLSEDRREATACRVEARIVGPEPHWRRWRRLLVLALLGFDRAMVHLDALPEQFPGWVVASHQAAGAGSGTVFWGMSDMVKVLEDWEAAGGEYRGLEGSQRTADGSQFTLRIQPRLKPPLDGAGAA